VAPRGGQVRGKVVAVTGGARGIGRATAHAASRAGARVAIGDLDGDHAQAQAAELGADVAGLPLDVSERDSFEAFLDQVEERLGPLDVLVNNAGILISGLLADESPETTGRMIDVNLRGVITGSQLAARRMVPRRRGHIVNVASVAGKAAFPGGATYCATKHAVVGLSESLHAELHGTGVAVSVVMPAVVRTQLTSGLDPEIAEKIRGLCEPEDVAEAIVAALGSRRFNVYVPRSFGRRLSISRALPIGLREASVRRIGADRWLLDADREQRREYLERVGGE
jgi:NAD(P)-dependent dehydrogenase (short-subunit alcohol dehydrogenase family)